jgi:predicted lipoprotein with Yx(FWY)xxD motif
MTSRRPARLRIAAIALAAIAASIALAACGDDDDSSDSGSGSASSGASNAATVSVQSIGDFGEVLVDRQGAPLYTNDKDSGSRIVCTDQCAADWIPLIADSGQPSSDDQGVQSALGVVETADGQSQVTYDGRPLYTFVDDSPGQVTGNGFADRFAGVTFTWTVATAGGQAETATESQTTTEETEAETETEDSGDSGGGSFGY